MGGCFGDNLRAEEKGAISSGRRNGGITAQKYIHFILPLVFAFVQAHRGLIFQQDNALSHRAKATKEALRQRDIQVLKWPSNSPKSN